MILFYFIFMPLPLLNFGGTTHSTTILTVVCMYERCIFAFDGQAFTDLLSISSLTNIPSPFRTLVSPSGKCPAYYELSVSLLATKAKLSSPEML